MSTAPDPGAPTLSEMEELVNPLERDHSLCVVLPEGLKKNITVHGRYFLPRSGCFLEDFACEFNRMDFCS